MSARNKGRQSGKAPVREPISFQSHELYGNGWLAGSHAGFRYKNLVLWGMKSCRKRILNLDHDDAFRAR